MPWTTDQFGGFSEVEPWLPMNQEHTVLSVENQEKDPTSTLEFTRAIINLRQTLPELQHGSIEFLEWSGDLLFFSRTVGLDKVYCIFNLGHTVSDLPFNSIGNLPTTLLCRHIMAIDFQKISLGVSGFCIFRV